MMRSTISRDRCCFGIRRRSRGSGGRGIRELYASTYSCHDFGMTTDTVTPSTTARPPARFRAGEARGARLGRPLKRIGRVKSVDEDQLALIGQRFMERDEVGAALARAMRSTTGDKVTMAQFHKALVHGIDSVDAAPPALRDFFDAVDAVPDWVDFDLVNEG